MESSFEATRSCKSIWHSKPLCTANKRLFHGKRWNSIIYLFLVFVWLENSYCLYLCDIYEHAGIIGTLAGKKNSQHWKNPTKYKSFWSIFVDVLIPRTESIFFFYKKITRVKNQQNDELELFKFFSYFMELHSHMIEFFREGSLWGSELHRATKRHRKKFCRSFSSLTLLTLQFFIKWLECKTCGISCFPGNDKRVLRTRHFHTLLKLQTFIYSYSWKRHWN